MCFAQKLGVPFSLLFALARSSTSSAASRLPLQNDNDAHDSFDPILVVIPRFFPRFTGESGGSFSIANQLSIFVGSIFILLLKVFAHVVLVFHFPADYRFRLKKSRIASLSGAGWTYTAPMGGGLTRRQRWGCSVICLCQPRLTWRGRKNMEASTTRTNWRVSTKQTPEFET